MSIFQAQSFYNFAFFSQQRFDQNRQRLNEGIVRVIRTNKNYPVVCVAFYGAYFVLENNETVFATAISSKNENPDQKLVDVIYLGPIKRFSHYPEEILPKEAYSNLDTLRYLSRVGNN